MVTGFKWLNLIPKGYVCHQTLGERWTYWALAS